MSIADAAASAVNGPAAQEAADSVPLVVDMDGTLVASDTLHESLIKLVKQQPLAAIWLPLWLRRGKAGFKQRVAERVVPDAALLPYNEAVLACIRQARDEGRPVVLATAASGRVAEAIAAHLGLFDEVIATATDRNLAGPGKRDALVARYGEGGFDYIGNSRADLPIWAVARKALLADAPEALQRAVRTLNEAPEVVSRRAGRLMPLIEGARLYQWVKNVLLFVPMTVGQQLTTTHFLEALAAFVCFGATASSVYILNDLMDLEADRSHPRKCKRPLASGRAKVADGLLLSGLLLTGAGLGALLLSPPFALLLLVYLVVNLNYSIWIKRVALVDVVVLAGLYTLRILAGGAATDVSVSLWLLGFSMFIFTSLAFAKRYSEVADLLRRNQETAAGRGYHVADIQVLMSLGTAAGMASVLTLALYVNSTAATGLYSRPELLWAVCPAILYWISRIWLAAQREEMTDDPIVFAFRDRASRIVLALIPIPVLLAIWL